MASFLLTSPDEAVRLLVLLFQTNVQTELAMWFVSCYCVVFKISVSHFGTMKCVIGIRPTIDPLFPHRKARQHVGSINY